MHRAFSVLIVDKKNHILLQQRASHKYHSPRLWSNSCCGHPLKGEKATISGRRRLKEELNIDCRLEYLFSFKYRKRFANGLIENEIDHVLFGRTNSKPKPNEKEVMNYCWMSLIDIKKDIKTNPQKYTFWFKHLMNKYFNIINNKINEAS